MAPEFGQPIENLPLIPTDILRKHHVHEPMDTRFRAAARLLQSLWREDRDLPIGSYIGDDGKRHKLGSRTTDAAGKEGANFLTPEIAHIARREVAYREVGAMVNHDRLATNLLSSEPLTFNLLAPLGIVEDRATAVLTELLPAFSGVPTKLLYEHSPGRGNPKFTADYSAFDAMFRYSTFFGTRGFVAIEIKYSETMREPVPKMRPRYDELSESTGLFLDHAAEALRTNPLQQAWRLHMLAQSMIDAGLYDEGFFVTIAPRLNTQVRQGFEAYERHLREPQDGKVRFVNLALEDVIEATRLTDKRHADALHRRYCDFWLVDGEMELNAATSGPKAETETKAAIPLAEAPEKVSDVGPSPKPRTRATKARGEKSG